jgi:hypothetical protein
MYELLQVAAVWLMYDNILTKINKISGVANSLNDQLVNVENLLRSSESRYCLLIEKDNDQLHGQKCRLNDWEMQHPIKKKVLLESFTRCLISLSQTEVKFEYCIFYVYSLPSY